MRHDKRHYPWLFKKFVLSNFPYIEEDFDALTSYQLRAQLVAFVRKMGIQVADLTALVKEFQEYFATLDIQDEVDKKIEEMAEGGELAEIISQYLNTQAAIAFDTVSDLKDADNLANGALVLTYGKNVIGDEEGQYYVIRPVTNSDSIDEINIIALNNLENSVAELVPSKPYTTIEANKLESDEDDTNALTRAVETGKPIMLKKASYNVSSSIDINYDTQITGLSQRDSIINYTGSDALFTLTSEEHEELNDQKTSLKLSNFKAVTPRFIRINDNTLTGDSWRYQTSWLNAEFSHLWLRGNYETENDASADTSTLPGLGDLLNYGAAFNCSSLFDSKITNCIIEHYGIAFYGKGCDINLIEQNRLNDNAIAIRLDRESTYGSQNRIVHNDIINNHRAGAITINGTKFDSIVDNYFEQYSAASKFIRGIREYGLLIDGNRFDSPTSDNTIIDLAPVYTDIVVNNRVNPGSSRCWLNVDHSNFDFVYLQTKTTAYVHNNNEALRLSNNVGVNTQNFNQLKISPYNMVNFTQNITGTGFTAPFFPLDSGKNLYYFHNTTSGSIIFILAELRKFYGKATKIQINCANNTTSAANMYVLVKGDGTQIHGENHSIPANDAFYSFTIDLTIRGIFDQIYIEIPTSSAGTMKIYSIELV